MLLGTPVLKTEVHIPLGRPQVVQGTTLQALDLPAKCRLPWPIPRKGRAFRPNRFLAVGKIPLLAEAMAQFVLMLGVMTLWLNSTGVVLVRTVVLVYMFVPTLLLALAG